MTNKKNRFGRTPDQQKEWMSVHGNSPLDQRRRKKRKVKEAIQKASRKVNR